MSGAGQSIAEYIARPFGNFSELFKLQAAAQPDHVAIICCDRAITYSALDALADQVAAGLQRDCVKTEDVVAICANSSIEYAAIFIGTLRAGATISPLAPSATPDQLVGMIKDSGATHFFTDRDVAEELAPVELRITAKYVVIGGDSGSVSFEEWLPSSGDYTPVEVMPEWPFNIIYSSGTTGTPKGIVQTNKMRWPHNGLSDPPGYGPDAVALISTGLYSNTTLVSFIPALAGGGTIVLMPKFDARSFLELSEQHRVTHAMLVPIQYRRMLDVPDFDRFDLSSYVMKFATSAPFPAELKAAVLKRWPGGLIEYYGMTEGGGSCMLAAHEFPDKLATVGRPMHGHDIRVISEEGDLLPAGEVGEVVGKSGSMMKGYHNKPDSTAEAEWYSPEGERFIRTGDLAVVDEDGFFTLIGRKKDMIVSGGFNVYPIDLEQALIEHVEVREAAVIAVKSDQWGETPVGFVTLHAGAQATEREMRDFANARLGKTQRISEVRVIDELPRSAIGKILKRELQDRIEVENETVS